MQIIKFVQTPNYDLNRLKMSIDYKIIAIENINTILTVDTVLTFC